MERNFYPKGQQFKLDEVPYCSTDFTNTLYICIKARNLHTEWLDDDLTIPDFGVHHKVLKMRIIYFLFFGGFAQLLENFHTIHPRMGDAHLTSSEKRFHPGIKIR